MTDDVTRADEPPGALEPPGAPEAGPVASIHDPRALQILTAEHASLQTARSLAYNESFTRGGMFLAFMSTSFVALALIAQAVPIGRDFLIVTAVVLAFDLVLGLTTYGRIVRANFEDYRAVHAMTRIRHGYGEIAPAILPYLTSSTHDDLAGVMVDYGDPPTRGPGLVVYQLTTSGGMINLIVSMLGGVLALVVSLIFGASVAAAFGVAALVSVAIFAVLGALTMRFFLKVQVELEVLFPTPPTEPV